MIQHGGLTDGDERSTLGTIIRHSGTAELTGLSGHATEARQDALTLVYTLER